MSDQKKLRIVGHDWGKIVHENPAPLTRPPGPKEPQIPIPQFGTTTVPNFPRPFSVDVKELELAHAMLTTQVRKPEYQALANTMQQLVILQGKLNRMLKELEELVKS